MTGLTHDAVTFAIYPDNILAYITRVEIKEGAMDRAARRAAVAAYKDRKPAWGVFAVICNATGQVWVGASRHVDTEQNGLWFSLRHGSGRQPALQAAWKTHGPDAFRFEELERLREDYPEIGRTDELKRRQALWRARLDAAAL